MQGTQVKFGVFDQIDDSGRDLNVQYEERMQLAELYDELGFHCFHQSEHHSTTLSMAPSQNVFLAAMAQRTKHLKLCPLVYLLPIHHPIRLAEEICMLDHLSNGRLEFGIGKGANPYELEALGFDPKNAVEAYREAHDIIQKFFHSDSVNHDGKFWKFKDTPVTIRPLQKPVPPQWLAVASAASAQWPAENDMNIICGGPIDRVIDIRNSYLSHANPESTKESLIGIWRYIVVADTDEEAMEIAEKAWPSFYHSFYVLWRKYGTEPQNLKLSPSFAEMVANGYAFAGSPQTVAAGVTKQLKAGKLNYIAGHFMFGNMKHADAQASIRKFAADVMPEIQAASSEWL